MTATGPNFQIHFLDFFDPTVTEYVDVDEWSRGATVRRGRQHVLDRVEAGVGTLLLWNEARRFDPLNELSPYWPHIRPMRKLRVSAFVSGRTFPVYIGAIEGWPVDWHAPGLSTVRVTAADAFKTLALQDYTGTRPAERTSARIAALLDAAGWSASWRNVETGSVDMPARTYTGTSILVALQEAATAEGGLLFVAADGAVTFHNRHHRLANNQTSAVTLSGQGPLAYKTIKFEYDDSELANEIRATAFDGTEVVVTDINSQALYGRRTLNMGEIQANANDVRGLLDWQLYRRATPTVRITGLTLQPWALTDLWEWALGLDLGAKLTVNYTPVEGSAISRVVHLEQIAHTIQGSRWDTDFSFTEADVRRFWQLDSATDSLLGTTTRAAY